MKTREASFALRVVRRRAGDAAILYRRTLNKSQQERFTKVGPISPLAFTAGTPLLRTAVRRTSGTSTKLTPGPFFPLDDDWGVRVACYTLTAMGLRNSDRLHKAAANLHQADATEAAWWFGLMRGGQRARAIRALRILVEAVR
jgi:hypothetical protein